jgi:hypothetical protein
MNSIGRFAWCKFLLALHALTFVAPGFAAEPAGTYEKRDSDWRNGAIVYQVLVDRFVPRPISRPSASSIQLQVLHLWSGSRKAGCLPPRQSSTARISTSGRGSAQLATRLDHIQALVHGAPIPSTWPYTNHWHDAFDFKEISPEYGTQKT